MKHTRVFVLCSLLVALALGLSIPDTALSAYYAGEALNLYEGMCYWKCYNPKKMGRAPADNGPQCLQLCAASCGSACIAMY